MRENKLEITINISVTEVFTFTITPPNSTLWIPGIVGEKTNELPVKVGTIYQLQNKKGEISEVTVKGLKDNQMVEWMGKDQNYHCRYLFKSINQNTTKFEYYEWVDIGEITEPFTLKTLEKLKSVLED